MNNENNNIAQLTVSQNGTTIVEDEGFELDLVLKKGSATSRTIKGIAIQFGDNDDIVNEIEYMMEVPTDNLEGFLEDTAGKNMYDIARQYVKCIWNWPLNSGKRTTREDYSPRMLNQLLKETYIAQSIQQHLSTVVTSGRIKDLHRQMRKGN